MAKFIIEQKVVLLANQYRVYRENGAGREMVGFVHQKRFALREKFEVFADESKQAIIFTVKARQVMDFAARYDVQTPDGELLGVLGKNFEKSLLRSTWGVYKAGEETKPYLVLQERSPALAVIRRIWAFVPILGDVPFFVRYHFDFADPSGQVVGGFNKTTTFLDHYELNIPDKFTGDVDWRVFIAAGILLDALQSR